MTRNNSTVARAENAPPEARLWLAVIAWAIEEWASGPLKRKREAEKYLFGDQSDFRLVCQSAGMDPECLRGKLLKVQQKTGKTTGWQVAA